MRPSREAPPLTAENSPTIGLRLARGSIALPASGGRDASKGARRGLTFSRGALAFKASGVPSVVLGELLALAIGGSARGAPSSQDPELNLTGHTLVTFVPRD